MEQAIDIQVRAKILDRAGIERKGTVLCRVHVDLGTVGWPNQIWDEFGEPDQAIAGSFEVESVIAAELVPPDGCSKLEDQMTASRA